MWQITAQHFFSSPVSLEITSISNYAWFRCQWKVLFPLCNKRGSTHLKVRMVWKAKKILSVFKFLQKNRRLGENCKVFIHVCSICPIYVVGSNTLMLNWSISVLNWSVWTNWKKLGKTRYHFYILLTSSALHRVMDRCAAHQGFMQENRVWKWSCHMPAIQICLFI